MDVLMGVLVALYSLAFAVSVCCAAAKEPDDPGMWLGSATLSALLLVFTIFVWRMI